MFGDVFVPSFLLSDAIRIQFRFIHLRSADKGAVVTLPSSIEDKRGSKEARLEARATWVLVHIHNIPRADHEPTLAG